MRVGAPPTSLKSETKPYLRWAGSKRKLLPEISRYWKSEFLRYVEPFAGSCCLFFKLAPQEAVLADKNVELIETHEMVRDEPQSLFAAFTALPRNKSTYLYLRGQNPNRLSKLRRAVRFLYLNRNCFNGIFRTNRSGQFNVPWSGTRTGQYPTWRDFQQASKLLQAAELRPWDFGTTLRHCRAGDFVYLDPPYAVSGQRVFAEYGLKMFSSDDLERLKEHLSKLDARGVHFLVSYLDSDEGQWLATEWEMRSVMVRRQVASFSDARRNVAELMISNYEPEEAEYA
ncbi:MAG: Dam family site-specific DNA-(adenine-N6)-methyltransferase [Pseudomonadota bacterium]